jgi:hypothetical protein
LSRDKPSEGLIDVEESTEKGKDYELPSDFILPPAEVPCDCQDHLEKKEFEVALPIPAKKLFDMLFGDSPDWYSAYHTKRGNTSNKLMFF